MHDVAVIAFKPTTEMMSASNPAVSFNAVIKNIGDYDEPGVFYELLIQKKIVSSSQVNNLLKGAAATVSFNNILLENNCDTINGISVEIRCRIDNDFNAENNSRIMLLHTTWNEQDNTVRILYDNSYSHPYIAYQALYMLQLCNKESYQSLWPYLNKTGSANDIREGAIDEDAGLRSRNHFYRPTDGAKLPLGSYNALEWANNKTTTDNEYCFDTCWLICPFLNILIMMLM